MSLFDIPARPGKEIDNKIAKKSNTKVRQTATVRGGSSLIEKIGSIKALVEKNLGHLANDYIIIRTEQQLSNYIDRCIEQGVISIDTETTGLDPLQDKLVGICIYTYHERAAYIPVNHISYITGVKVEDQLSVDILKREFQRIIDRCVDVIMFNAAFDIRFMKQIGVRLHCAWDCYLGARCLNENEGKGNNGLKQLHKKYILNGEGDAFSFDTLFSGITFDKIPINVGYIYAAHDAIITYELYQYQKQFLTEDSEECIKRGLQDVAWVFHNIEMPCIDVIVDMEETGVDFDFEFANELHNKYHDILDDKVDNFIRAYSMYQDEIDAYNGPTKLEEPININSIPQLQALIYDIIGLSAVDKKKQRTRSTSEEILQQNKDNAVVQALLEYREFFTIVSTFIDKLPNCVNPKDGRIHCKFNQYGADTGRMSSQDPNLQNIPSHNKDIRKMFKATDGYVLMSADYSQQEPKAMTMMCQDPLMIKAYQEGKDLYAEIASLSFNTTYENCLEFRSDGTTNVDGKNRRSQAKSILLGVLYGRGVPSIAEQLGTTTKKAQAIKDSVMKGFPAIEKFEKDSIRMAKELGYVTTLWGRKRRLPSMMKPDYEFVWQDGVPHDDDILNFDSEMSEEVPLGKQEYYRQKLAHCKFGEKRKIFEQANAEGIYVIDNTMDKDTTKVVNARIQGSAADMTKLAMIKIGNDERLKELGFRLLIPVHDELIAECPEENAKECVERFSQLMSEAPGDKFTIPIKCDVEVTKCWYGDAVDI